MREVESRSSAKMRVQREDEMNPETKERYVEITGTARDRGRALKLMLDLTNYCRDEDGKLLKDTRPLEDENGKTEPPYVLEILPEAVGRVLGRNGETVKYIEKSSNAKVEVDKNTGRLEVHGRREAQEHCVELILAKVTYAKSEDGVVLKDEPRATPVTDATPTAPVLTIWVKNREAGRVIGRNGETVQEIMKKSSADVKVQKSHDMPKDSKSRHIRIFGTKEQQELALDLVLSEVSWAQGEDGVLKAPPTPPDPQRREERSRKKQLQNGDDKEGAEKEEADVAEGVGAPPPGPASSKRRGSSGLWVCGTCGGDHRTKECPHAKAFLGMGMQIGMQMGMQAMGMQNLHMGMPMGGVIGPPMMPMMGMPGMPSVLPRGRRRPGGGGGGRGRRGRSSSESSLCSSGRSEDYSRSGAASLDLPQPAATAGVRHRGSGGGR